MTRDSNSHGIEPDLGLLLGLLRAFEFAIAIGCLVVFSEGLTKLFDPNLGQWNPDGSPLGRAMFYPAYLVTVVGAAAQSKGIGSVLLRLPFITGLVAFAVVSTAWSVDADLTIRRSFALAMTTLFGFYLAVRFDWRCLSEIVASTFFMLAILSIGLALVVPSLGRTTDIHIGAWTGIFVEKNALGGHMARGVAFTLLAAFLVPKRAWLWSSVTILLIALVFLSTSKTALIGLAVLICLIGVVGLCTRSPVLAAFGLWGTITAIGLVFSTAIFAPELIFGLIGRDSTLTGRVDIWSALQPFFEARPWHGYGYAAFWNNLLGPAYIIREQLEWRVPNAHNGWMEVRLGLGLIGLALIVAAYVQTAAQSITQALRWPVGPCVLAYILVYLLFSASESMLLQHNNLTWVLFVMVAAKLVLAEKEAGSTLYVTRDVP